MVEGNDLYGDGVNIAARLEGVAEPGGILLSGTAYDQVKNKIKTALLDIGPQTLKNISEPVRAYRVTDTPTVAVAAPKIAAGKPSIAVLPFTNMSGDPEQEYFSDGITEDIITELSRFRELLVIARNSTFQYKGRSPKVQDVARELGVRYIVEGSVRKAGGRVRVTAQFIEAQSGVHLWAERYDRELADIFALQDEVAGSIVGSLSVNLRETAMTQARARPTENLTAYDYLLRSRASWWRGDGHDGFEHLQSALAEDPKFAAAHAWLALQYAYEGFNGTMEWTPEHAARLAHQHAEAALKYDDHSAFVQMAVSMAFNMTLDGDKARGLRHSDAAVALNPHDFEIMYCRAYVLAFHGRHEEALIWLEKARRVNPIGTYMLAEAYSDIHYMMGNYEKALEVYRGEGDPPVHMLIWFAAAYAQLGRAVEAARCLEQIKRTRPPSFDPAACARLTINICTRPVDAERWREGFRKAGIRV
jgi:TolB-like protein